MKLLLGALAFVALVATIVAVADHRAWFAERTDGIISAVAINPNNKMLFINVMGPADSIKLAAVRMKPPPDSTSHQKCQNNVGFELGGIIICRLDEIYFKKSAGTVHLIMHFNGIEGREDVKGSLVVIPISKLTAKESTPEFMDNKVNIIKRSKSLDFALMQPIMLLPFTFDWFEDVLARGLVKTDDVPIAIKQQNPEQAYMTYPIRLTDKAFEAFLGALDRLKV